MNDQSLSVTAQYTHTTIEWVEPRIWDHERDARDAMDGRDINPITETSPVARAIATTFARKGEWIKAVPHIEVDVIDKHIDATITISNE